MTNEEIDALWFEAMRVSIQKGDDFTRFEFARLVAAAEREACAKVCEESDRHRGAYFADKIRAKGEA